VFGAGAPAASPESHFPVPPRCDGRFRQCRLTDEFVIDNLAGMFPGPDDPFHPLSEKQYADHRSGQEYDQLKVEGEIEEKDQDGNDPCADPEKEKDQPGYGKLKQEQYKAQNEPDGGGM